MAQKKIMAREEFRTFVKDSIGEYLPENYEVFIQTVDKPTGAYVGIGAREEGSHIAPILDSERFYEKYLNGDCLKSILEEMADIFKNTPRPKVASGRDDLRSLVEDFDRCRTRLFVKLLNTERVPERVVKMEEEDLALVPYVLLSDDREGMACFAVTKDILDMWKVSAEDIFDEAVMNSECIMPVKIMSLGETLGLGEVEGTPRVLVVTNEKKTNGASVIFYPSVLDELADRFGGDFMLIPSSIHEMLALPLCDEVEQMKEMVTTINASEVRPEDRLTDSVYRYDHESRKIIKEA